MPEWDKHIGGMPAMRAVWYDWGNRIANELGFYGACPNCGGRPCFSVELDKIFCDRPCGFVYATFQEIVETDL